MKKLKVFALLITAVLMTACSSQNDTKSSAESTAAQNTSGDETKASEEGVSSADVSKDADLGETLVVYFSQTGNTKRLAELVAAEVGADLFEVKPKTPYTQDDLNWRDENSRVVKEHENLSEVSVELENTKVDNFDSYDTVFIGYPIWWREASWVLDSFVKDNDFSGKKVITFGTSMSTGDGESGKRLERLTDTGDWIGGERFPDDFKDEDVKAWIETLAQ